MCKASFPLVGAAICFVAGCSDAGSLDASEETSADSGNYDPVFVQAFVSTCVRDFRNTDRVAAAAEEMDWVQVTDPGIRRMIGPENGNDDWRGWAFEHEQKRFMLILTNPLGEDAPERVCTLIGDTDDLEATVKYIVDLVEARPVFDEADAGQTTRMFEYERGGEELLLSFLDAQEMNMPTLNASVLSKPRGN